MKPFFKIVALAGLLFFTLRAAAQTPGFPDPAFGTGGWVTTPVLTQASAYAVVVRPNGKIVAGGIAFDLSGGSADPDMAIVQYQRDGAVEWIKTIKGVGSAPPWVADEIRAMALEKKGSIIAAGISASHLTGSDVYLIRIDSVGKIDVLFGGNGYVRDNLGNNPSEDRVNEVAIDSSGRIVIVGEMMESFGLWEAFVARYLPDGSPDLSFDGDGLKRLSYSGYPTFGRGLAIQADQKIVVGGFVDTKSSVFEQDPIVFRLKPNGDLDASFGVGGITCSDFGFAKELIEDIALEPKTNDRIVMAGVASHFASAVESDVYAVAVKHDGFLDPAFGTLLGATALHIGSPSSLLDYGMATAVDSAGRILIAGFSTDPLGVSNFYEVACLDKKGVPDPAFGPAFLGYTVSRFGPNSSFCYDMAIDYSVRPYKIVLAGSANSAEFGVARLSGYTVSLQEPARPTISLRVHPNPWHGSAARVVFDLPAAGAVYLRVHDMRGRQIAAWEATDCPAGVQQLPLLLPALLPAGVYTLSLYTHGGCGDVLMVKGE